ncbi:MAG: hypothetical protein AAF970_00440, partial [Bacteroidota bacterium]
ALRTATLLPPCVPGKFIGLWNNFKAAAERKLTVEQRELAEALAADEEFVQYMKIQMERARPMTEAFLALSPEERAERQAQLLEAADRFKAEVEQMETMTPEEQQALIDEQRALMAELGVPTPMPSADEQADMQRLFTRHPGLMKLSQEEVQSVFATAMSVSGAFEEVAP